MIVTWLQMVTGDKPVAQNMGNKIPFPVFIGKSKEGGLFQCALWWKCGSPPKGVIPVLSVLYDHITVLIQLVLKTFEVVLLTLNYVTSCKYVFLQGAWEILWDSVLWVIKSASSLTFCRKLWKPLVSPSSIQLQAKKICVPATIMRKH